MANKWRGEVPFAALGKGVFISFPLEDLAELEEVFGEDFFGAIEGGLRPNDAMGRVSPKIAMGVLSIGLKRRVGDAVQRIWDEEGRAALQDGHFKLADAAKPILDAISLSWLQKSYDELLADALDARKKNDAALIQRAKEAAEQNGIPFDEALSDGLLKLLIGSESIPSQYGD